jgi:hypothetical protein
LVFDLHCWGTNSIKQFYNAATIPVWQQRESIWWTFHAVKDENGKLKSENITFCQTIKSE